jgi:hypothetical protein
MAAMRLRRAVAVALSPALLGAAAAGLVPACTGEWSFDLPPVEGGVPDPRFASACAAWASAYCEFHHRCDGFFFSWTGLDQCEGREQTFCQLTAADPNVTFDEQRVASCQYPSDCAGTLPVCWPRGSALNGAPCLQGQDCRSGICSGAQATQAVCGVCACGNGCTADQTCNVLLDGGTCVPLPRAPGAPCSTGADCGSTLCVGRDGDGTCAPYVGEGGVCVPPAAICDTGLYCASSGRCMAPERVGYDAACGYPVDGGTATFCTTGASCLVTCRPPADDGQECDPAAGAGCLFPAKCVARRCIFPTLTDCSP